MMTALDKICQVNLTKNSKKSFSSTMHLSCIDALFKNESISQNSQLGNEIGNRIIKSPNFTNIKTSYKFLKNTLSENSDKC